MKDRPKLVIFDLDGTLVEFPQEYLLTETERILAHLQHPEVTRDVLEDCFADFDFFRFLQVEQVEEFVERFWSHFDWARYPSSIALRGAATVLKELADLGLKIAIATARRSEIAEIEADLEQAGLREFFICIEARNAGEDNWQDKQRQIRDICRAVGVLPAETVMVGDIPADIITAKQAGVGLTVAVLSGGIREAVLRKAGPDIILNDLNALVELLFPSPVNPS